MEARKMAIAALAAAIGMTAAAQGAAAEGETAGQAGDSGRINLVECPKCEMRMRISADGASANINLCRLKDDRPDSETLARRIETMKARAERFLARGAERATGDRACPLMGWSSWNTFGVEISERVILETARAMATNGLKEAGYVYVNIDDGFFWGHGDDGILRFHPGRFPNGMKPVVDGIHALGMKAGIYSDAGADTCGSMWGDGPDGGDKGGVGGGLYGHDAADCKLHFGDLGFDFIKVDYCGGQALHLDERVRYTEIAAAINEAGGGRVRFNVCRWAFPGVWIAGIADSWRTTYDIRANWKSVKDIIAENLYLGAYASPGHFNDLDMLEVGHRLGSTKTSFASHGDIGLTQEEERTHFGMWCMMSSPLLIGCDARKIPADTLRLVTNPYLVAMDQNRGLGVQGQVVARDGDVYILAKDADERFGRSRYVAVYNSGDGDAETTVWARDLDLGGNIQAFDLVEKADVGEFKGSVSVRVPAHGAKFYLFDADERLERTAYEAEAAFLSDYQELVDADSAKTATPAPRDGASGGVVVRNLGWRESNDLVWKDVCLAEDGERVLEFKVFSEGPGRFFVETDGSGRMELATAGGAETVSAKVRLAKGVHTIRLFNGAERMPDVDAMLVRPVAKGR